jgi:O-antigen/teichoic acid export membrane protein
LSATVRFVARWIAFVVLSVVQGVTLIIGLRVARLSFAPAQSAGESPLQGILSRAAPFWLAALFDAFAQRVVQFRLLHVGSGEAVGQFAVGFKLAELGLAVTLSFVEAVYPRLCEDPGSRRPGRIMKYLGGLVLLNLPLMLLLFLSGEEVLEFLGATPRPEHIAATTLAAMYIPLMMTSLLLRAVLASGGRIRACSMIDLTFLIVMALGARCLIQSGDIVMASRVVVGAELVRVSTLLAVLGLFPGIRRDPGPRPLV